ncbi:DUF1836 domain-containing protein [Sutcliffiella halmapala]|uniref:DUF1836 domain-containing protein n=1 Tax=Sutcliffiella halmapala TaxID=79882 RepID=UPI0009950C22|nr:DUF1836 domain-containing protein [Sutcliffiella halmapala]
MAKGWTRLELAELLEKLLRHEMTNEWEEILPRNLQNIHRKAESEEVGLTMSNIVWFGNQLESAGYTEPALKNWVKREIKEYIGTPQVGKKYSIQQAAILFIVKDMKVLLDFDAIRRVLKSIFNNPVDRTDDIIHPLSFYKAYACLYENLIAQTEMLSEAHIKEEVHAYLMSESSFSLAEKQKILRSLVVAVLSVRTTYLKTLAKRYVYEENGKD